MVVKIFNYKTLFRYSKSEILRVHSKLDNKDSVDGAGLK